jgi:hypothetical protein
VEKKALLGVWVWLVVMCPAMGWKTAKAEVVRTACQELVLAGNKEFVIQF